MEAQRIKVTRSSMPSIEEYTDEIRALFSSHMLTNAGVKHQQLEEELTSFLDVDYVSLFVNGHSALEAIFEAMELGRGEVITTPFSFISTANAIARKGLTPVFADIDPFSYTLDPNLIEPLISDKTVAIVPVHVYGNICDVDAIQAVAERNGLKVIYDAAHAFGETWKGRGIGSFGDASMFSFHATKVFNTIEGGAVTTSNRDLYSALNCCRNFGLAGPEDAKYIGGNSKMNEFCAAMGLCNLRHVSREISKRKAVASRYTERLCDLPGVEVRHPQEGVISNYAYYPVLFNPDVFGSTRDEVFDALEKINVGSRKYFYPLITDFECYRDAYSSSETPVAKHVADNILTLPMYADLAVDDIDRICDTIHHLAR